MIRHESTVPDYYNEFDAHFTQYEEMMQTAEERLTDNRLRWKMKQILGNRWYKFPGGASIWKQEYSNDYKISNLSTCLLKKNHVILVFACRTVKIKLS